MAVMDEFKQEREAIKNASLKGKLSYFWDYYKWYVIGGIIALILIIVFVYDMVSKKDIAFNAALVNCYDVSQNSEDFPNALISEFGIDAKKYSVIIDSSYNINYQDLDTETMASTEKIAAYVAASMLDILIAGDEVFENFANSGYFCDIRDILSDEEIEKYEPYFYYVDSSVLETSEASKSETSIPVGIYIDECDEFLKNYVFLNTEHKILGVFSNIPHKEYTEKFINYIFN